jgi:hypothetical protein
LKFEKRLNDQDHDSKEIKKNEIEKAKKINAESNISGFRIFQ